MVASRSLKIHEHRPFGVGNYESLVGRSSTLVHLSELYLDGECELKELYLVRAGSSLVTGVRSIAEPLALQRPQGYHTSSTVTTAWLHIAFSVDGADGVDGVGRTQVPSLSSSQTLTNDPTTSMQTAGCYINPIRVRGEGLLAVLLGVTSGPKSRRLWWGQVGAQISTDLCNAKKVVNLSRVANSKDK
ncbi:GM14381 [Drosophila sechellia]|uniref:GM14381 n=1 Tax=Drosophila sechellia TaxID=7238 RepID=B4HVP3_DROSE|nr:GM14381 [Drosophila sechellia]